jgi:hypothetical protein
MDLCLDGIGIYEQHLEIERLPRSGASKNKQGEAGKVEEEKEGAHGVFQFEGKDVDNDDDVEICPEFGLRVYNGAKVHLNGALLEIVRRRKGPGASDEQQSHTTAKDGQVAGDAKESRNTPLTILRHGDRIILGPCRFVAVFLAFDPDEKKQDNDEVGPFGEDEEAAAKSRRQQAQGMETRQSGHLWEYSAVVAEMMQRVGRVPRLFGNSADASAEGRLWEELLRGLELVTQANEVR